jgi:hypothetical protein
MRRLALLLLIAGCGSSEAGDPHKDLGPPNPLGDGKRIAQVTDPTLPDHPASLSDVNISAAVVTAIDTYDETGRGARGTIYIQDINSQAPYSAIGLFSPTFVPGDLRVAPGDVLDFSGQYQENGNVGSAKFDPGELLIQLSRPIGKFRFEYRPPEPAVIDLNDLATFATGRKWQNMLVTVKNVTLLSDPTTDSAGRIGSGCDPQGTCSAVILGDPSNKKSPTISNELYAVKDLKAGMKFSSVTGIVTYFFKFHIAPRSAADLVP